MYGARSHENGQKSERQLQTLQGMNIRDDTLSYPVGAKIGDSGIYGGICH